MFGFRSGSLREDGPPGCRGLRNQYRVQYEGQTSRKTLVIQKRHDKREKLD
jgi:hypothetical protein